jgi:NAD-dependent deacetylase
MEKKKIMVFSGAGVSKESGIETFRDSKESLWNNYKIEDVATPEAWKRDKELVLDFYNARRKQLKDVEPNDAHYLLAKLEENYDVTIVTQNVDNLHERAGSTNVIHLHGELTKSRSTLDSKFVYECEGDINIGDKCEKGSQLRPNIIWFGEQLDPKLMVAASQAAVDCDICIIVGTSMAVYPASSIPFLTVEDCRIFYVDPGEKDFYVAEFRELFFKHVQKDATVGIKEVYDLLTNI